MTLKEMVSSKCVSFDNICTSILRILGTRIACLSALIRGAVVLEVLIATERRTNNNLRVQWEASFTDHEIGCCTCIGAITVEPLNLTWLIREVSQGLFQPESDTMGKTLPLKVTQ